MAAWFRVLANPKVLKRFLGTKAGKKATIKYGSMLLRSKMARNALDKFINRNGASLSDRQEYKKMVKEYSALQKRIDKLESQLDKSRQDNAKMQELTFSLGRCVVEMNQMLAQLQAQHQSQIHQMQIAMANTR